MQVLVHSEAVARNFSAAASSYERWADPQRRTARRLMNMLSPTGRVNSILDVGCGTGFLVELLHDRYPEACILGIDIAPEMVNICLKRWAHVGSLSFQVADAERFDTQQPFDLITSSFCFQWFSARVQSIGRLAGMLKSGGLFALAVPVAGSLVELHESYQTVLREEMPGLEYASPDIYINALDGAGFKLLLAREEAVQCVYKSGLDALRSFKGVGALFKHHWGYSPRSASEVQKVARYYEHHHALAHGRVPVTYQVLYLVVESIQ